MLSRKSINMNLHGDRADRRPKVEKSHLKNENIGHVNFKLVKTGTLRYEKAFTVSSNKVNIAQHKFKQRIFQITQPDGIVARHHYRCGGLGSDSRAG